MHTWKLLSGTDLRVLNCVYEKRPKLSVNTTSRMASKLFSIDSWEKMGDDMPNSCPNPRRKFFLDSFAS